MEKTSTAAQRIRFRDPRRESIKVKLPQAIINVIDRHCRNKTGKPKKHYENVLYEVALAYRTFEREGSFKVNRRRLDALYSSHFRKLQMMPVINEITETVKSFSPGISAKTRAFTGIDELDRYPPSELRNGQKNDPQKMDPPTPSPPSPLFAVITVEIPGYWLWNRYEKWDAVCHKFGWTNNLDLDGRTPWGKATRDSVAIVDLNKCDPWKLAKPEARWQFEQRIKRIQEEGASPVVMRRYGRVYHEFSNFAKGLRDALEVLGERTVEVDVHAAFVCILARKLEDRELIIRLQSGDFYSQFAADVEGMRQQLAATVAGTPCPLERKDAQQRLDSLNVKVEFMRQCLFWQDARESERPLWTTLKANHPKLAARIERLHRRNGSSGFAKLLQRLESRVMVDKCLVEIAKESGFALGYHDGIMVTESYANRAKQIIEFELTRALGFAPRVVAKSKVPTCHD